MIVIKIILIKDMFDTFRQKWKKSIEKFIVDYIHKNIINKKQQKKEVKTYGTYF